jgi:hypothetical protein
MTTEKDLTVKELMVKIQELAPEISSEPLTQAYYQPENDARSLWCFDNVRRKVQKDGGDMLYGWMFGYRISPKYGKYLRATHHAVWVTPDQYLLDVTPFPADPNQYPLTISNYVIFLPDSSAEIVVGKGVAIPLPTKFFALSDNHELREYVKELNEKEQKECQEMLDGVKIDPNEIIGSFVKP